MVKTGLFLCSIGLLLFVYNANQNTGSYNWLNMIMGITLIGIGLVVFLKGNKEEKAKQKREDQEVK